MGILANNPSPPPFTVEAVTYLQRWNFVELAIGGFLFFSYTVEDSWGSRTVGWSPKKPSSLELTFLQTTLKSNHIDETTLIKSGCRLDKTILQYYFIQLDIGNIGNAVIDLSGGTRKRLEKELHEAPSTSTTNHLMRLRRKKVFILIFLLFCRTGVFKPWLHGLPSNHLLPKFHRAHS